jgi:diguanylate cyclase (GGDEF)-like protein
LAQDNTIHLLIVHEFEEEAEKILSYLRNSQIAIRPSRCIDEDKLNLILSEKRIDVILAHQKQDELPLQIISQVVNRIGKDIPIVALLDALDEDSILDAYQAGVDDFCTQEIPEQLCKEVSRTYKQLKTRRKIRILEAELNDAEKRCSSLLDNSKDAISYIHDGMHVYVNNAYLDFFECDDIEEMEVTPFLDLVVKSQVQKAKELLKQIASDELPEEELNMVFKTQSGNEVEAIITLNKATVDGEPCVQFLVQPPKRNLEAEKELEEIKNKDLMTGYYNRRYFISDLNDKILAIKGGKEVKNSILYVQLDNVKELGKELGKGKLDLLIADIAAFIKEDLGTEHNYTRYEESTFMIQIAENIEQATLIGEHLNKKVAQHLFSAGDKTQSCSISIAITQIIEQTDSTDEILKILTKELEIAKENGGNQLSVFDPAEEEKKALAANQRWIDAITHGLENHRFFLNYQQVVSLHGEELEHYEILVRLKLENEIIMPDKFIPVAKKYKLQTKIDRHVIKSSINAINFRENNVALFIKVSTFTMSDTSFPAWLANQIKTRGILAERLIFEIPESELVTHSKAIKPILQAVKALNCKITIEKFGSGLNSFTLLKHFPVDYIKIDSIFMEGFAENTENQEKVKALIDQGHSENKIVICEHIEDAATMSILWKYSANFVQGNFLSEASTSMIQPQ